VLTIALAWSACGNDRSEAAADLERCELLSLEHAAVLSEPGSPQRLSAARNGVQRGR
jgi:hypothetical protein